MPNYSGRTTAYEHKFDNWKECKGDRDDCIKQVTVFDVQWSNCPVEVAEEVKKLWIDQSLRNDTSYAKWVGEEMKDVYPLIAEYLKSRNIGECLIHWWW